MICTALPGGGIMLFCGPSLSNRRWYSRLERGLALTAFPYLIAMLFDKAVKRSMASMPK